jgi:hypothetical protein
MQQPDKRPSLDDRIDQALHEHYMDVAGISHERGLPEPPPYASPDPWEEAPAERGLSGPLHPIHGSPYFDVREFVDRRTWNVLNVQSAMLIDPQIVLIADALRELAGPLTVNNWHFRGPGQRLFDSSGFRARWDATGGLLSQHRCGRAADFKSNRYAPGGLLKLVLQNADKFRALGLTTIEEVRHTPTWLHLDCRPRVPGFWPDDQPFRIVSPV